MRKILIVGSLIVWPALLFSGTECQYWNNIGIDYQLTHRVELQLGITHKFVQAARELGQYNFTPGIGIIISPKFDVTFHYKFQDKKDANIWRREHRFDVVPSFQWNKNTVRYRLQSKIEYRNIESERFWRFREKVSIEKHLIISDVIIDPFMSAEIFYMMAAGEFTQVRVQLGASTPLSRVVKFEVYYVRNISKAEVVWRLYNAIGTKIALAF